MKLQSILAVFIVVLLMPCWGIPRGCMFGKVSVGYSWYKERFTKIGFSIYFGGSNHLVCISRIVCCSLDPVLGFGYSISCIFFAISVLLFKFKKRGFEYI